MFDFKQFQTICQGKERGQEISLETLEIWTRWEVKAVPEELLPWHVHIYVQKRTSKQHIE